MQHAPVLVSPPDMLPVSLDEAKLHLRVDSDDEDHLIGGLIEAATAYLDGWTGILGRCLVEQEWRQDFDGFARELCLPLGAVNSIATVTWRNAAGQVATVPSARYDLRTDASGRAIVRFDADYEFSRDLHESRAVSVTYKAGWPTIPAIPEDGDTPATPAQSTVPAPIKVAILLMIGHAYKNREAVTSGNATSLPLGFAALTAPYRRAQV